MFLPSEHNGAILPRRCNREVYRSVSCLIYCTRSTILSKVNHFVPTDVPYAVNYSNAAYVESYCVELGPDDEDLSRIGIEIGQAEYDVADDVALSPDDYVFRHDVSYLASVVYFATVKNATRTETIKFVVK